MLFNLYDGSGVNANSYLYIDGGEAILVDAAVRPQVVKSMLFDNKAKLKYIIVTHGHFDHLTYLHELLEAFPEAEYLAGKEEVNVLPDKDANVSELFGFPQEYPLPDKTLSEGDKISSGDTEFSIIETPGHTPGSICLYSEAKKLLFTGDLLFVGGIGRTDFKYGSYSEISKSLSRIALLPEDVDFYPGHGQNGRLGAEFGF